jgi:hypothetical protein
MTSSFMCWRRRVISNPAVFVIERKCGTIDRDARGSETMNAGFLRDEAPRFRGMAEDADREATKTRLLAMAADYETRAGIDVELTEPDAGEGIVPTQVELPKITLDRKVATGLTETVMVQRRPVGRSRRE